MSAPLQAASTAPEPLPRRAAVPPALLVRATVPGLLRLAAVEWAWMGACWLALARWPWVAPLAVVVLAGRLHALGVIFHDAVHLSVRRKGLGLWLVEALAGYPVASTWESTRYHHLRHHYDAGLPSDPYRRRPLHGWRLARAWLLLVGVVPFWVLRGPVGLLAWAVPPLRGPYARLFLHPDVLHFHGIGPGFFTPLARLLGMRTVVTHHARDYLRPKWTRRGQTFLRLREGLSRNAESP